MSERDDWSERSDFLFGWEAGRQHPWEYGIFDNPNGPYLRSRFLGTGKVEVHPAVDPQTSMILGLVKALGEAAWIIDQFRAIHDESDDPEAPVENELRRRTTNFLREYGDWKD